MRRLFEVGLCLAMVAAMFAGCKTAALKPAEAPPADLCAVFTPTPVQIDGTLDDPVWKDAPV